MKTIPTGAHSHPAGVVYDPKDNKIFVADSGGRFAPHPNITVISAATNKVVDTIHLSTQGLGAGTAYDPANGELYFVGSGVIYAVNGSSDQVLAKIPATTCSLCKITVNAAYNEIYVASCPTCTIPSLPNDIMVISGKTNTIVRTFPVRTPYNYDQLLGIAYDPCNKNLYVALYDSSLLYAINPFTGKLVANITLPAQAHPTGVYYYPSNKDLYVLCQGSSVVVVSGSSNKILTTVPNTTGISLMASDKKGELIGVGGSSFYVINGSTNSLRGAFLFSYTNAYGMAVASSISAVYVSDYYANRVLVILP